MLNIISFPTASYFLSISNLGSGSDFAPFMYRIGVPAVDMRYSYDSVSNACFIMLHFSTASYFLSISNLGSGSDFAPFMYRIGVPAFDMSYTYDSVSNNGKNARQPRQQFQRPVQIFSSILLMVVVVNNLKINIAEKKKDEHHRKE